MLKWLIMIDHDGNVIIYGAGGGRPTKDIAITLANHLIFASFLHSILLGPKGIYNDRRSKFLRPPNDASDIFRLPSSRPFSTKKKVFQEN